MHNSGWRKLGWTNSWCHLHYGQEANEAIDPASESPTSSFPTLQISPCPQKVKASSFLRALFFPRLWWQVVKGHQITPGGLTGGCPSSQCILWWEKGKSWQNATGRGAEVLQDLAEISLVPAQDPSHNGIRVYVINCSQRMAWKREN